MNGYQWAIALHVTSAFFLVGGGAMAAILSVLALRRERPSEVALLLGLTRWAVAVIGIGSVGTLGFGLWLVHEAGYSYGAGWIVAAIVLWAASGALGGASGSYDRETRELAERLAAEGDGPTRELAARLRSPRSLLGSWGAGVILVVVLALMVWKPGS